MNPAPEDYLPLMRTQLNAALAWIQDGGFNADAFEVGPAQWGETNCTRFAYSDSPYFLDVSTARSSYSVRHSPGASELLTHLMSFATDFEGVERPFKAWLSYLRREVDAPDLWALVRKGTSIFAPLGNATDNSPFAAAEITQVVIAIDAARLYLSDAGVTGDALAQANQKLDYLVGAAKRAGRMDWFNIALSVVMAIAIAVAFDTERARELLELLFKAVDRLLLR